jgi:hypothetical protein
MNPEALFKLINVMEKPVGGSSPEEAIHPSASQPQREAYQVDLWETEGLLCSKS